VPAYPHYEIAGTSGTQRLGSQAPTTRNNTLELLMTERSKLSLTKTSHKSKEKNETFGIFSHSLVFFGHFQSDQRNLLNYEIFWWGGES
jgi:hypothetical protein